MRALASAGLPAGDPLESTQTPALLPGDVLRPAHRRDLSFPGTIATVVDRIVPFRLDPGDRIEASRREATPAVEGGAMATRPGPPCPRSCCPFQAIRVVWACARTPDEAELRLMYENLYSEDLGVFASAWYWSSSEYNGTLAWGLQFDIDLRNQGLRRQGARRPGFLTVGRFGYSSGKRRARTR